jgi:hypothetical protein
MSILSKIKRHIVMTESVIITQNHFTVLPSRQYKLI